MRHLLVIDFTAVEHEEYRNWCVHKCMACLYYRLDYASHCREAL